jgi:hypothetical protein
MWIFSTDRHSVCLHWFRFYVISAMLYRFQHTGLTYFMGWWVSTGIWTQGLELTRQVLYHLNYASSPFFSRHFLSRLDCTMCLLFYTFCNRWDDRLAPPCLAFFCWDWVSLTFCLGWSLTVILQISTSRIKTKKEYGHEPLAPYVPLITFISVHILIFL